MEIWLESTEGDMIRVDEFAYLYHLKKSKEYGHYKLVPWERKARIVTDLPLSFRYWKSRFFFVFRDDWETLLDEVWGTPLGYSKSRCVISLQVPLLSFICSIFCVFLSFSSSLTFLFVVCSYEASKAQKQV